jgi:RNA polymerase subunit RPABC4/transcription elongation factor Spt4
MPDYQQPASEPFSEKLRRIRFRMKKETFRLSDEIRLVPRWLLAVIVVLYVVALVTSITLNLYGVTNNGEPWPPGYPLAGGALIMAAAVTGIAIPIACVLLLIGYVNRDAKRRGMNSTLWTLLVIMLVPAYLATGFIIYFLVREPLPYDCPHCGSLVSARFNYCPNCDYNLHPTCARCRREVNYTDRYCPYCGFTLRGKDMQEAAAPVPEMQPETRHLT